MGEEKKKSFLQELKVLGGLPWWLYLLCTFAVLAVAYTDTLGYDAIAFIAFVMAFSIALYKFGKILPIWNTYIGGGLLMVFFGCALLKQFNMIPEGYLELVDTMVQGDVNILSVFIIALIMGSILSLDRKVLLRSFAGYVPAILGGLFGAALFGVAAGFIFGVQPIDMIIKYVLPIMGGGNGAGAVPLSQIYEQISGEPAANY